LAAGGGFGGSGGGASNKKPKETKLKLKPKQQWDRFQNLKTSPKMRVAVQTTDDDQWLEVGNVKAAETVSTAVAVARQRALIAEVRTCIEEGNTATAIGWLCYRRKEIRCRVDVQTEYTSRPSSRICLFALFLIRYSLFLYRQHAKRLFPLQISPKDTVIWAFWDTDTWTIVDKAILEEQSDSLPANVEKLIGFEGRPDPSSGMCPLCVCALPNWGAESVLTLCLFRTQAITVCTTKVVS
jgi:hypothetical protein